MQRNGLILVHLAAAKAGIVRSALDSAAKNIASKKKKTPNAQRRTSNAQ
jgi:hypothetical protein